ncbi:MAG: Na+/H+ antiporter NhaC family protein [Bacteroidales bacterium]|nr:Na+/H+ antiporter NhaC family protein [Bacteroidales bacterium]
MSEKRGGLLALTPILVFLGVYLVTSVIIKDFYKVPVASAFLLASIYAVIISKGPFRKRIDTFSEGAGNPRILLMVWIFILAGAFAQTAQDIGAIDATVNLTLRVIPGSMLFAGLFFTACFISMSVGTSVGTIVALVPIATGIAQEAGFSEAFMAAIIVGGAFFGDNLSFISDTTIAATKALDCAMKDKFKANIRIVAPAVLLVFAIYIFKGLGVSVDVTPGAAESLKLLPYLLVLVLALAGMDVLLILSLGIGVNLLIGLFTGSLGWADWLSSVGEGISGMGSLIIVTVLAGGMMALIRAGGGLDWLVGSLTRRLASAPAGPSSPANSSSAPAGPSTAPAPGLSSPVSAPADSSPAASPAAASPESAAAAAAPVIAGSDRQSRRQRRGAELSIAALVSLANLCTANNTIAIITVGGIAKDISDRFGLDRRRVASILDTFSCFVQGLIPYGAQLLMASGLAGVGAAAIIRYLYYPFALGLVALAAIFIPASFRSRK